MADGVKTAAGLALVGGAIYFLWRSMGVTGPLEQDQISESGTSRKDSGGGGKTSVLDFSSSVAASIRSMSGNGEYTADEWGWYYAQVTGVPAPPPEDYGFIGDNRFRRIGFEQWWSAIKSRFEVSSAAGVDGIGRNSWEV